MSGAGLLTEGWMALAAAAAGLAAGFLYFRALAHSTEALAGGGHPAIAAGLTLLRLLGIAGFLFLLVRFGAVPLLGGLAGILAARAIVTRQVKGAG